MPEDTFPPIDTFLSVDTFYDVDGRASEWFGDGRTRYYESLEPLVVPRLPGALATHADLLAALRTGEERGRPYRAVTISSHGRPGAIYDSHGGTLISEDDPPADLRLLARGRALYFCCCEAASPAFVSRLISAGARMVVGFTGKPGWLNDRGRLLWGRIDLTFVRLLREGRPVQAFLDARRELLDLIAAEPPPQDFKDKLDLMGASAVLETMVIRPSGANK